MSSAPQDPLHKSKIPIIKLKDEIRTKTLTLLESISKPNNGTMLILDPSISGPLGVFIEVPTLRSLNINSIFTLGPNFPEQNPGTLTMILRPSAKNLALMLKQIKNYFAKYPMGPTPSANSSSTEPPKLNLHIIFVPRATLQSKNLLEQAGYFGGKVIIYFIF